MSDLETDYRAEDLDLQPITLREAIRLRPGMYLGGVGARGLATLVWEVVCNAIDEHLKGHGSRIDVTLHEDGSVAVQDHGRGIAVDEFDGMPIVQRLLTDHYWSEIRTADGESWNRKSWYTAGLVAVNALSAWLTVDVFRKGVHYRQRYERGLPVNALERVGLTARTGTRITFLPDPEIFPDPWIDPSRLQPRLREVACLRPGLTVSFVDQRENVFHEPLGVRALLDRPLSPESFWAEETVDGVRVECAVAWRPYQSDAGIVSFANLSPTLDGGTHVEGLLAGMVAGLRKMAPDACRGRRADDLARRVRAGFHMALSVQVDMPLWNSSDKVCLMTPEARPAVRAVVKRALIRAMTENADLRERVLGLLALNGRS